MDETKELEAALFPEEEPLLPDGWKEGDNLFPPEVENGKYEDLFADELTDPEALLTEEDQSSSAETAPTTDGDPEDTTASDAEEDPTSGEAEPDGEQTDPEPAAPPQRKLRLKVNHKEETVDVNQMSDEELIAAIQKSRAYDSLREAENKRTFRAVYQEEIDNGMSERAAQQLAREAAGGKVYSLEDSEETAPAVEPEELEPAKRDETPDFSSDMKQLKILFPDVKDLPDSVVSAAAQGVPLLQAYIAYRSNQEQKTVADLRKENKILKQNAASAAKSAKVSVTGVGGKTQPAPKPAWEKGWDAEKW